MAVRSGAGTGVIVSLVIFIVLTIFTLVMSIVFYSKSIKMEESASNATSALNAYATSQERGSDPFRAFEQAATQSGGSVAGYLDKRYDDLATFVIAGQPKSIEEIRADLGAVGVKDSVRDALVSYRSDLKKRQAELETEQSRAQSYKNELDEKDAEIKRNRAQHEEALAEVGREISSYRQAAEEYRDQVIETTQQMEASIDELRGEYEGRIAGLENELDGERQQLVIAKGRLDEYESILDEIRIKSKNPALLVDAEVIDVNPSENQLFINRGRNDRIVLGMTFEIYDNASSIVPNRNGVLPRGKASVQVTKVGSDSSTCKVTRSVAGRPIVRNNVAANAVYDPERRFKFLVHGKYDIDNDGRPTSEEAEHLRSLVLNWGGEVVDGDDLPGDLDFLVLGAMPPLPRPLQPNATEAQIRIWAKQREARLKYETLMDRAIDAQIPVLNANRFFILIGHTGG